MKCAACGYEKRDEEYTVDEVIRFKAGKRKGEVKEVKKKVIEPDKDKKEFEEIEIEKQFEFVRRTQDINWNGASSVSPVRLFMCPECGTIRAE